MLLKYQKPFLRQRQLRPAVQHDVLLIWKQPVRSYEEVSGYRQTRLRNLHQKALLSAYLLHFLS